MRGLFEGLALEAKSHRRIPNRWDAAEPGPPWRKKAAPATDLGADVGADLGAEVGGGTKGEGGDAEKGRGAARGGGMARAGGGGPAAALVVLSLSALALALAGGALAAEPYAAAEGTQRKAPNKGLNPPVCNSKKRRPCKRSPLCKWGASPTCAVVTCAATCAVAKDACDAVQGRQKRKKCGRVSTKRCQCSLNPGKKRGKCGACVAALGSPLPPDPACPRGVKPGKMLWKAITSSSDGTKLAAVANPGGTFTNSGGIWTSCDSGQSWTLRSFGGIEEWTAITSSSDGTKLAAVVNRGGIWTSTDSGQSWTEWRGRQRFPERYWRGITSSSDGTKLAAVESGPAARRGKGIWTSWDSGQSWRPVGPVGRGFEEEWLAIASSSDGTKLAAAGNRGIWTSTDSGLSWKERSMGTGAPKIFHSITSSSDGNKLAALPLSGKIWTSSDSGLSWTSVGEPESWKAITSSSNGKKLAAASNSGAAFGGNIWTSTNSGQLWTARSVDTSNTHTYRPIGPMPDWWDGEPLVFKWDGPLVFKSGYKSENYTRDSISWQEVASSSDGTKLAAVESGLDVAGSGDIWTSTDSGQSWRVPYQ